MRRWKKRDERGQALTEFAAIAVMFFMLVFGILEMGRAFYYYSTVVNAAQDGARYGTVNPTDTNGIRSKVRACSQALDLADGNIVISYPDGSAGFGDRINVAVNYSFNSVVAFVPSFPVAGISTMRIVYAPSASSTYTFTGCSESR